MQARWLSRFLDQLGAVLGTAAPLFGQSKLLLEKPGLDPALPEPTKSRLQLMDSSQSFAPVHVAQPALGASSPAAGSWQVKPKKKKPPKPPFSIVLGEQEPLALNFRTSLHHPDGRLPNPTALLLFLQLRLGCAEGSFPRPGPAAKGLLSPLHSSQRNVNRERVGRKWRSQLGSSPGSDRLLCLCGLTSVFKPNTSSDGALRALFLCTNILH